MCFQASWASRAVLKGGGLKNLNEPSPNRGQGSNVQAYFVNGAATSASGRGDGPARLDRRHRDFVKTSSTRGQILHHGLRVGHFKWVTRCVFCSQNSLNDQVLHVRRIARTADQNRDRVYSQACQAFPRNAIAIAEHDDLLACAKLFLPRFHDKRVVHTQASNKVDTKSG